MGAVYFYHLTRSAAEDTLLQLLPKAMAAGWRVVVRGRDRAALDRLDARLWLVPEEGFLAHGLAGGPFDADQPVLLTDRPDLPNTAACVMALDGAEVRPDEAAQLERVCILFDGNDPEAVNAARTQWRGFTGAGIAAQYWSEESGRWQKKAEHPPA